MEGALRHKLGEGWRQDLLKLEVLNWEQKSLTNAELAYLTAERKHVQTATPVKRLSLSQNPSLTDIKILKNFIEVMGGKIEDLDIADLALDGENNHLDIADEEDAKSYYRLHDFLTAVIQLNPGIKKLAISHLSGAQLNIFRSMQELEELDIHNSHFRTPVNSLVFRTHDSSGSISTRRWRAFLLSPPPKLKKLFVPPYYNNTDENLLQAEELAAKAEIELIKKSTFEDVRFDDNDLASLQDQKIPIHINGRRVLVALQNVVLPGVRVDQDAAKKIQQATTHFIFWHLSAASQIGLANILYQKDGSISANVKYRIGDNWYSMARDIQILGIPYGQSKTNQVEWGHLNWENIYLKHKAKVDQWARATP
jgi:hypothetical protein